MGVAVFGGGGSARGGSVDIEVVVVVGYKRKWWCWWWWRWWCRWWWCDTGIAVYGGSGEWTPLSAARPRGLHPQA